MEQYPGNSQSQKPNQAPKEKKVTKIISSEPIRRKKSFGKRFTDTFISGEDAESVFGYLFSEVFVPAAKDTISDIVTQGIDRVLFGEVRGRGIRSRTASQNRYSNGLVSYNRISSGLKREEPRREMSRQSRATHNFDEIILETRVEAQEVIDGLNEIISMYEMAKISDLYDMCGIAGSYTDEKWGWFDLRGSRPVRVKGGYLLDLPKPELID